MLLVITIKPTGQIDLNSAEVELTGKAFELLRPLLHECAEHMPAALAGRSAMLAVAEMAEQRADHAALRKIGFTKLAVVLELSED